MTDAEIARRSGTRGTTRLREQPSRPVTPKRPAAQMLVKMMEDTKMPFGARAKIAQDLLERAGLVAAQVHQIVPTTDDPIMRFLEGAVSDPNNWVSNPQPDPTPAIESYPTSSRDRHDAKPEEIVEAEIVEPKGEPANDTPPRIAEMIKAGAFDRKAGVTVGRPLPPVDEPQSDDESLRGAAAYQNSDRWP